jgi:hypothetical protein
MSGWETVWDVGREVVGLGADVVSHVGKTTPWVGTALNGIDAAWHYGREEDALNAGDHDKADYEHDRGGLSVLKAIPGVGTVAGIGELAAGGISMAGGGGFHEGMETFDDYAMDIGAALGIGALGAPNPIPLTGKQDYRSDRDDGKHWFDSWGSHKALRKSIENRSHAGHGG